ncbi:hypothetical protein FA13DRAFT_1729936 [Coprinellus micaceus]|uniref:Uncharacterized protein n=1 Tax=Coprinellus micaceus TaxID=71717 RepID=A0A4Y7THL5_COPMI|nr:hypothetical protein FA13DRAFT_1729936 [Coprinellus micaceus]
MLFSQEFNKVPEVCSPALSLLPNTRSPPAHCVEIRFHCRPFLQPPFASVSFGSVFILLKQEIFPFDLLSEGTGVAGLECVRIRVSTPQ